MKFIPTEIVLYLKDVFLVSWLNKVKDELIDDCLTIVLCMRHWVHKYGGPIYGRKCYGINATQLYVTCGGSSNVNYLCQHEKLSRNCTAYHGAQYLASSLGVSWRLHPLNDCIHG